MKSRREIPSAAASARTSASVSELASIEQESYSNASSAQPGAGPGGACRSERDPPARDSSIRSVSPSRLRGTTDLGGTGICQRHPCPVPRPCRLCHSAGRSIPRSHRRKSRAGAAPSSSRTISETYSAVSRRCRAGPSADAVPAPETSSSSCSGFVGGESHQSRLNAGAPTSARGKCGQTSGANARRGCVATVCSFASYAR